MQMYRSDRVGDGEEKGWWGVTGESATEKGKSKSSDEEKQGSGTSQITRMTQD